MILNERQRVTQGSSVIRSFCAMVSPIMKNSQEGSCLLGSLLLTIYAAFMYCSFYIEQLVHFCVVVFTQRSWGLDTIGRRRIVMIMGEERHEMHDFQREAARVIGIFNMILNEDHHDIRGSSILRSSCAMVPPIIKNRQKGASIWASPLLISSEGSWL